MSDYEIDHEIVRAHAEKRLEPRIKLWRRRRWLLVLIVGFVLFTMFVHGPYSLYGVLLERMGLLYWDSQLSTFVSKTLIDPMLWAAALWIAWGLFIPMYAVSLFLAFGREGAIQREINREMELEKMRLQLQLARIRRGDTEFDEEKPKHVASLSDDGEILFEEKPTWRNTSRRQR